MKISGYTIERIHKNMYRIINADGQQVENMGGFTLLSHILLSEIGEVETIRCMSNKFTEIS